MKRRCNRRGNRYWTPEEEALLREFYPHWPTVWLAPHFGRTKEQVYAKANSLGLSKSAAYLASEHSGRLHAKDTRGLGGRFPKGHVPANKGMRRPGYAPGRMAATQFKKGRAASEARNYVPIGTEKVDRKRKVLMRKITDDPSIFPVQRWRPVHVLVWEAVHGSVPDGHIVIFKPGLKTFVATEITIDRLELVTLAENMRRNTIHNLPPELVGVIRLKGTVKRQINRRLRDEKQDR